MRPTPFADALDRLTGGDVVRVPSRRHRGAGEYDQLALIPRRELRQLRGGGWLARRGIPLDVLAGEAGMTCDEFLYEYRRLVRLVIAERRQGRHARCYRRRAERARAAGFESFWHYRKEATSW